MAKRPIFKPSTGDSIGASEYTIEFDWHPGMASSQKQKNVRSLHEAGERAGIFPLLEISTKSESEIGRALSAFNLSITTKVRKRTFTVESAFQSGKVFERGGPYTDILDLHPRAAKSDIRLKESGNIVGFDFFGKTFPAKPRTFFYDWIYINALQQNVALASNLMGYEGFSDIEFNPIKSINCQARSAALYVSMISHNALSEALSSPEAFLETLGSHYGASSEHGIQPSIL